jgi:hypothetical protein
MGTMVEAAAALGKRSPMPFSQIRNPKFETNSKLKIQMTLKNRGRIWTFEFGICFGFRASDFEFSRTS